MIVPKTIIDGLAVETDARKISNKPRDIALREAIANGNYRSYLITTNAPMCVTSVCVCVCAMSANERIFLYTLTSRPTTMIYINSNQNIAQTIRFRGNPRSSSSFIVHSSSVVEAVGGEWGVCSSQGDDGNISVVINALPIYNQC